MNTDQALGVADAIRLESGFVVGVEPALIILAAEVRRLRDDAASTAGKIIKMTIEHDWAIGEAKRPQAENRRLRKNAAVSAAIERATRDLPVGDMLEITVEKDSATVVLFWSKGGFETMDVDDENRLAAEINAAINAARSDGRHNARNAKRLTRNNAGAILVDTTTEAR